MLSLPTWSLCSRNTGRPLVLLAWRPIMFWFERCAILKYGEPLSTGKFWIEKSGHRTHSCLNFKRTKSFRMIPNSSIVLIGHTLLFAGKWWGIKHTWKVCWQMGLKKHRFWQTDLWRTAIRQWALTEATLSLHHYHHEQCSMEKFLGSCRTPFFSITLLPFIRILLALEGNMRMSLFLSCTCKKLWLHSCVNEEPFVCFICSVKDFECKYWFLFLDLLSRSV